jgi:hypothetical protein
MFHLADAGAYFADALAAKVTTRVLKLPDSQPQASLACGYAFVYTPPAIGAAKITLNFICAAANSPGALAKNPDRLRLARHMMSIVMTASAAIAAAGACAVSEIFVGSV